MDRLAHWQHVYQTKQPDQVSWFQAEARLSRQLIEQAVPERAARIIDIGAGASTLVDGLLDSGYTALTVVDISEAALSLSQARVGEAATRVEWRAADVLTMEVQRSTYALWHDRAVFHFLTEAADRARYVAQVKRALQPDGFLLVATFAEDGPMRCSGLDVRRYSAEELAAEFGAAFQLVESRREEHRTPSGSVQAFTYCLCRYRPEG